MAARPAPNRFQSTAPSSRANVPADRWQTSSSILTECRRLRALAATLRGTIEATAAPSDEHDALVEFVRALEATAARGDVAADMVLRQSD
ncbi:MAG: hypothetical protein JWN41_389 [Thermoleophilia bacterium]|nr:hypothetical protein [Thermoleophilia bacterium]